MFTNNDRIGKIFIIRKKYTYFGKILQECLESSQLSPFLNHLQQNSNFERP